MGDSRRTPEFAKFVLRNYPPERFKSLLIPADGNLLLSRHLAPYYKKITAVDPNTRVRGKCLHGDITLHCKLFMAEHSYDCDAIIGMHPDEATGEIIQFSRLNHIPFAIVPCCPLGRFGGRGITYNKWMNILKDISTHFCDVRNTSLNFGGRNLCLFSH